MLWPEGRVGGTERGAVEAAGAVGASPLSPKTSFAIVPIPPREPISAEASIGISTILEFFAVPISARASVYFWATK